MFFEVGLCKNISIVGLFPTLITDQRSLSLEKQRPSVSLRSCANAEGYGELSFVFIKSTPLVQQLGLTLYFAAHRSAVA